MILDPNLLLSVINTKLRNDYSSLDDYCLSENVNKAEIVSVLLSIGYVYDDSANSFKQK